VLGIRRSFRHCAFVSRRWPTLLNEGGVVMVLMPEVEHPLGVIAAKAGTQYSAVFPWGRGLATGAVRRLTKKR
jgi:hypothetical protein